MLKLHRYYKRGTDPLKSISTMPDEEAIAFMQRTFPKHTWFHAAPEERMRMRRDVEAWLLDSFKRNGGEPVMEHPVYFSIGASEFLKTFESFEGSVAELTVPLDRFSDMNISFTYPDSFFSWWLGRNPGHELYDAELNGKVFTLEEMLKLIADARIPYDMYMETRNYPYPFYVEAQVWDMAILSEAMDIIR